MKIDHIAIYTDDLEEMKNFFIKFFGGKAGEMYHNTKTNFRSYFISFNEGMRLEIMTRPDIVKNNYDATPLGYHHMSFSVGERQKVDSLTNELVLAGYTNISGPRTTGDGYYESQISGPEGIIIEISE